MSLFRRKKSVFPKLTPKKSLLHLGDEELPLKLPKKSPLGKIYKVKKSTKPALIVALALAVITPIVATALNNSQIRTQSKAYQEQVPAIRTFVLVNADTNEDIMSLAQRPVTLDLADLPPRLNLRADTVGRVDSVSFYIDNRPIRLEENAPYSLAGDANGDYAVWEPVVGTGAIRAVAASLPRGQGTLSQAFEVQFTFIDSRTTPETPEVDSELKSETELSPGDCNADGVIDTLDLAALKLELEDDDGDLPADAISGTYTGSTSCDADEDLRITELDHVCIQAMILGSTCK